MKKKITNFIIWLVLVAFFIGTIIFYFNLPIVEISMKTGECVRVLNADGTQSKNTCDNLPDLFITFERVW